MADRTGDATRAEMTSPLEEGPVSREQLWALLGEAAEVEHNLMCCYLYAAFSVKDDVREGITAEQVEALGRWRRAILSIAVEEMGHLAIVANLTTAVGGPPNFSRLNFPISAGALPANMTVRLTPFDMDTLDHFIFLERPEGSDVEDSGRFHGENEYRRGPTEQINLMPVAQDYPTVGAFYAQIRDLIDALAGKYGEVGLFVGAPDTQIGPRVTPLPGLMTVSSLKEAHRALDTIVEQGEGAPDHRDDSHFARFCAVKAEYERFLAEDPDFTPARPVAENPVSREPPTPKGKVWVRAREAATVMDFVNALYLHMLRLLTQAFGRPGPEDEKRVLVNAATDLMHALAPAATAMTRLPANDEGPATAGMSFAMTWSTAALPRERDFEVLRSRFEELVEGSGRLEGMGSETDEAVRVLRYVAEAFSREVDRLDAAADASDGPSSDAGSADASRGDIHPADIRPVGLKEVTSEQGEAATVSFDTGRCIHARFCVTGAPATYLSGVEGQWLHPDETDADRLVAVTERCPSGAVFVVRRDGGREERAPPVNLVRLREHGPLAFDAELRIDGAPDGFRRTLCRCGRSRHKPYCDGSHAEGFEATGEPPPRENMLEHLPERDGPLDVYPLPNGPLQVVGPLEICMGTGTAIARTRTVKLCRCGRSRHKPFCDNSHIAAGFRTE